MQKKIRELTRRRRGRSGFTLIEIMLVVVIIGILAAIAVPNVSKNLKKAKINRAKADINAISTSLELYLMDVGTYPGSLQGLVNSTGESEWDGPYYKGQNSDFEDPWGNPYQYSASGDSFALSSSGLGTEE